MTHLHLSKLYNLCREQSLHKGLSKWRFSSVLLTHSDQALQDSLVDGTAMLPAGFLCALMYGAMLCALCACSSQHLLVLALPCAVLAAVAYFGVMNAAVLHAVLPHTSPLARVAPGTATALARQIVRCLLQGSLCKHRVALLISRSSFRTPI